MKATESKNLDYIRDFQIWQRETAADNGEQLQRMKRNLRFAREHELTAKQRLYLQLFYEQGLSMSEIARREGLHRSTVLRTIQRGQSRLQRCLQYSL